ncbi:MAG: AAA family ATPase [Proteobacteria bacterium]|nr:AAA family ATPase [Pseudomonadota bacterium]
MDYLKIVHLSKEPFSNSPDPEFFFQSSQHVACLQKLELSLRLRRGLNVVIGDIGTGKTTLCRQIIRRFAKQDETETHLILDPKFSNQSEFLNTIAEMFGLEKAEKDSDEWQIKERIKNYLFQKGVDDEKKIILIIDEGQKIPVFCIEILREFLNYETNEYKLLQIVIFAQREFEQTLKEHANFADRMNVCLFLGPLNFRESRLMIKFRLDKASMGNRTSVKFSYPALWAIYKAAGGYPRKIINLCHQIILTLIIQNRFRVNWALVRSCVKRVSGEQSRKWHWAVATVLTCLVAAVLILSPFGEQLGIRFAWKTEDSQSVLSSSLAGNLVHENEKDLIKEEPSDLEVATAQIDINPLAKESVDNGVHKEVVEDALPNESIKSNNYPEMLGQIRARYGETVLEMVYKIYGTPDYNMRKKILSSVVRINQHIKNLDGIYINEVINFPAMPIMISPLPTKGCWALVDKKDELESAYQFMRIYPDSKGPLRMVPYWNSRDGLQFAIIIKAFFADEESAEISLKKLPSIISSGAKIITNWDDDTVFFSNVPIN